MIVPKNHKESTLYEVLVTDDEDMFMPPPHEEDYEPADKDEVALVARWIDEGASFTDPVVENGDGDGTSEEAEENEDMPAKELEPMPMRVWRFLGSFIQHWFTFRSRCLLSERSS